MSPIPARITALRQLMAEHQIDAYLIPSGDPHQSEYVAPRWETRAWMSGFTGSAGTLIVTQGFAGLWTDSRYFLQGEEQLAGSGIQLMRQRIPHAPEHLLWLADNVPTDGVIGFDGQVVSVATAKSLQAKVSAKGIQLKTDLDLPGIVWGEERPAIPTSNIFELREEYAGESRASKLQRLREWLNSEEVDAVLLVALDEIAWTLNIRASDVDYNPVCISYLLVDKEGAHWFVGEDRVSDTLSAALTADGVKIAAYEGIVEALTNRSADSLLAVNNAQLSYQFQEVLAHKGTKGLPSPVAPLKTIKNATEIAHFRKVMAKDGIALLRLFRWIEYGLAAGNTIDEVDVAERLTALRYELDLYQGDSFPAIVGYQANGAIVHYRAEKGTCATLQPKGMLLLDSGGQYLDGTTDITRTVALGETTTEQREHFTLVLKGMIALSQARFPQGTGGAQLDTLARQHLWQQGLNYGHGTGHGVGFFLNVHEGPQGFATSAVTSRGKTAFEPGMVTSNEPGFYRVGQYGIRTENLILCVTDQQTDYGQFLRFETLTLFPIDHRLIVREMMTEQEMKWLNRYHGQVLEGMMPLLTDEDEKAWLVDACARL